MKSDKFDLVLILDSQSPQTINCNMNDKVEKTLKEFASMKKIEYSLLDVVLYGGKALLPEDRKKLFSDISSSFDKYEKKMTLVFYIVKLQKINVLKFKKKFYLSLRI